MASLFAVGTTPGRVGQTVRQDPNAASSAKPGDKPYVFVPSQFFPGQLTAFKVWISRGGLALTSCGLTSLPPPNDGHPTVHLRKWNQLIAP